VRSRRWTAAAAAAACAGAACALGGATAGQAAGAGVPAGIVPGVCVYAPNLTDLDNSVGLPPAVPPAPAPTKAVLETSRGTIALALDAAAAPCTVNSFAFLAKEGFFEGGRCHRMLNLDKAGVLQCGDPTGTGSGGPGYEFGDENLKGAEYPRGTVAMANHGYDTNGSQFFLVFRDSRFAPDYTPFGTITGGLDVLDKAAARGTYGASNDEPKVRVVLHKVTVS
jgi:peptidyl-prolyl cis-trans isomerase B (cyclophilin B)